MVKRNGIYYLFASQLTCTDDILEYLKHKICLLTCRSLVPQRQFIYHIGIVIWPLAPMAPIREAGIRNVPVAGNLHSTDRRFRAVSR